jgi:hypothetical protein
MRGAPYSGLARLISLAAKDASSNPRREQIGGRIGTKSAENA